MAVVIYHGERPWQGSTELLDLYDLPSQTREDIAEYLPRLRIIIDDLTRLTDDEVRERTQLTVCARLVQGILRDLRFARDKGAVVRGWWRLANQAETEPAGLSILEAVAYYVLTVVPEETRPEVLGIMQENVSENTRSAVRTAADSLREEGREEGQAREAAEAVLDVFEARGIAVSAEARDRIMTCKELEQLRRWRRRAVVAGSVGEIFEV